MLIHGAVLALTIWKTSDLELLPSEGSKSHSPHIIVKTEVRFTGQWFAARQG